VVSGGANVYFIQNNKFPLKVNLDNFISAARGYLNFPATHLAAGIRWQREGQWMRGTLGRNDYELPLAA